MDTSGNFFADLRFCGAMARALDTRVGGAGEQRVWDALMSLPSTSLSGSERQAVLTLTRELGRDGDINGHEANELLSLIGAYSGGGAPGSAGPFVRGELARYSGNTLYAGLAGALASAIGGRFGDTLVQTAAGYLLDGVRPNFAEAALRFAFNNVDLSRFSSGQKQSLLTMLAVAAGDGRINNAEARAMLKLLDKGLGSPSYEPVLQPQSSAMQITAAANGTASIDLGDGYSLQLNESGSELKLYDANTGTTTDISGDPHVYVNGQHIGDFYGTTTLVLDNGTKITINTVPYAANQNAYLSSSLTITKGDQLIKVSGLDQNTKGDLSVQAFDHGGYLADWTTKDGLQLYENPNGSGWMVQDGLLMHSVTQADFDSTKPGALVSSDQYAPLALYFAAGMLGFSFGLGMLAGLLSAAADASGTPQVQPLPNFHHMQQV
jgi:hypothetical protein